MVVVNKVRSELFLLCRRIQAHTLTDCSGSCGRFQSTMFAPLTFFCGLACTSPSIQSKSHPYQPRLLRCQDTPTPYIVHTYVPFHPITEYVYTRCVRYFWNDWSKLDNKSTTNLVQTHKRHQVDYILNLHERNRTSSHIN
jgi:hypothetical protein